MRPFMRLFVILIVFGAFPAHAQSARPAITAANASTVVELARFGQGQVSAAAWSPDGKQLAVGGSLGVWLYDRSDFTLPPRLLDSHSGWISSLAYNGDGSLLALRSNTGIVQVWNVQTEELRQTIDVPIHPYGGRLHVAFSPDGTRLVTDGAKEAPGLWDVQTGAKIATLNDWITDVIYSPDGKTFVLGTIDGQVQVWDAQLGELLRQYEILIESIAAPNTIDKLAYSYDNSLLAVGREDGTILLLDARTGEIVKTWKGHACEYLSGTFYEAALSCEIYSLAFSPDGKTLVSGAKDGLMKLWDVATGEHWKTFDDARVQELAFSPDGTLLTMVGSDNVVRLWNTTTYDHDLILDGFNNTPEKALEFSPDGSLLAAADYYNGGLLHFWDTESWVEQAAWKATLDDIADLAFAPDGHELVASQAEQLIQKWWIGDSINGVVYFLDYYDLPSFRLSSLAYSPDGDMLAFGGCVDEEGDYFCNYTHVGMDGFYAPELKDRHDGEVDDIAFSPDGTLLAAAEICGYEGQVQV
ncbi:MAG TPA: hypothetical protein VHP83_09690, partial [Aggregatilineaceae bacterium]|nr:hypothetical protein [Aggregatilineaceae bacterium]